MVLGIGAAPPVAIWIPPSLLSQNHTGFEILDGKKYTLTFPEL
jgi:hypothetical protein